MNKNTDINNITYKMHLFLFIIPFMIVSLTTTFSLFFYKQDIFPSKYSRYFVFTDDYYQGISIVDDFKIREDKLVLTYTLKEPIDSTNKPSSIFTGLGFFSKDTLNFNNYDYLKIRINTSKSKSIVIQLLVYLDHFTQIHDRKSYLFFEHSIPVLLKKDEYYIDIKHFKVPEWWYQSHADKLQKVVFDDQISLSDVKHIHIKSSMFHPTDVTDTITISELSLVKSRTRIITTGAVSLIVYLLILGAFWVRNKYKRKLADNMHNIIIPYKQLALDTTKNNSSKKLLEYIGENFTDPELTVEMVARECSIPVLKIPKILKKHFKLTFPQYLNAIRLTEAKRLLAETEIQIIEIAMNVGYNNVTYFNRVFKRLEGTSPVSYRKINQQLQN